jgi:hypothetical protein
MKKYIWLSLVFLSQALSEINGRTTTATLLKVKDTLDIYQKSTNSDPFILTQLKLRPFPYLANVGLVRF